MKNELYQRIRAACCDIHGLGQRNEAGRWIPRNSPEILDEHAAQIVQTILKLKTAERRTA